MQPIHTMALASCLSFLAVYAGQVQAQSKPEETVEPVNYIGLHAGVHNLKMWPARVSLGNAVTFAGKVELEPELAAGLTLGREYKNSRYEVEYQRGNYRASRISLNTRSENVKHGKGFYQALTLNAYRTQPLIERLKGYAGLGIGYGKAKLPAWAFTGGCACFPAADAQGFVWQARVGLEYRIGGYNHLGLHYARLMRMPGPTSGKQNPSIHYAKQKIDTLALEFRREF